MKKQPALWKMKCRLLFGLYLHERENYANWSNTPLSQMALMSFCKMVMGACRFVFLVYVDDRAIYEFREAERMLCR